MTRACPRSEEVTRLLDGELTENRAAALRAHLGACASCAAELEAQQRLVSLAAAPMPGLPREGGVEAVMQRIDAAVPASGRRPWRTRLALGGIAFATAASILVVGLWPRATRVRGEFAARGSRIEWTKKVGVELWALDGPPRRISAGDGLLPGVAVVASFSNVDASPAYLLAFAVDAGGEAHWLYPGFTVRGDDPSSVRLDASVVQRALPESVILEGVAQGPLRFMFVVTREPLRVSSIEAASARERTPAALRARFPEARIDELLVTFGSRSSAAEARPPRREVLP